MKPIVFVFILILSLNSLYSEENKKDDSILPAPYQEDEFPQWMKDLRRGEIIFFGSIPLTLFFSFESYDLYRYAYHDFNSSYSPWPFISYSSVPYTSAENIGIILGAVTLSVVIAVADYLIGRVGRAKSDTRAESGDKR